MPDPYYQSPGISIYHGDCREILPSLPKVDLVLTDPPYSIGATRGEWGATAAVAIGIYEAAKRVSQKGSLVAFTTTSGRGIEFVCGAVGKRLPFNRLLTWHKWNGRSRAISPWLWDSVAILVFGRAPNGKTGQSSVISTEIHQSSEHPAELPPEVCKWVSSPFYKEGLSVLDPFMGTGSLLKPARSLEYDVIGIEKEERYCEIAAKRLSIPPATKSL